MDTATSNTTSSTGTYDSKFFAPIDMFEEAPPCHYEDTMPTSHHDMLMCPMYSSSGMQPQHPLDPSPKNTFYLQNHQHQTPTFMDNYQMTSSASPSNLNSIDHPGIVPFHGHFDEFYRSCAHTSPSSYLQYLQQSPSKHQNNYTLQPSTKSKAETTPLDILDPPTGMYSGNPMFSANPSSDTHRQAPLSSSSLDLSQFSMDPPCPSSVEYMDVSKPSWMLDSLDNTYLPATLDFYENDQNNENPFYLNHHSYLPQQMSSNSLPSSSHQHESDDLSITCLPRSYVNLSDVNSFVAESDSIKHTNAYPHPSKCANRINGGGPVTGDELQSLLGDISPATPSNNNSNNNNNFLSHSFVVPPYLNPQPAYSYSDSNESMDDLSDSDTTTSTQSWMIPFPQEPFFSWRDSSSTPSTNANFYPLGGGLTSSMSTPVVSTGPKHPRPYPHHSHPFPHPTNMMSGGDDMTTTHKREKPNKRRTKQQQQQQQQQGQLGKTRRSASGIIQANGRKKSAISNATKRKELKRRESEPHSLNAINTYPSSSSVGIKSFPSASCNLSAYSPARLSVSESISSFLSRQRLSDDDEEEEDAEPNHEEEEEEEEDSDQGVYLPQRHPYQSRLSNDHPFSQKPQHHQHHVQHKDLDSKTGLHYHSGGNGDLGGPPTSHPKKGRNVDKACNHCKRSHLRCDNMRPCRRCIATGKSGCKDVEHKPRGRPRLHNS